MLDKVKGLDALWRKAEKEAAKERAERIRLGRVVKQYRQQIKTMGKSVRRAATPPAQEPPIYDSDKDDQCMDAGSDNMGRNDRTSDPTVRPDFDSDADSGSDEEDEGAPVPIRKGAGVASSSTNPVVVASTPTRNRALPLNQNFPAPKPVDK